MEPSATESGTDLRKLKSNRGVVWSEQSFTLQCAKSGGAGECFRLYGFLLLNRNANDAKMLVHCKQETQDDLNRHVSLDDTSLDPVV